MATLLERLAEEIAVETLKQVEASGDERLVDRMAKMLLDSSPTFHEAFLTNVRFLKAAARGRAMLAAERPKKGLSLPPADPAADLAAVRAAFEEPAAAAKPTTDEEPAVAPEMDGEPVDDDVPYADAELVDEDEPMPGTARDHIPRVGTGRPVPKPKANYDHDAETPMAEPEITGPRKRNR